jgi:PPOX class probable FMN-dependent enzyme
LLPAGGSGCQAPGRQVKETKVDLGVPITTEEELRAILGEPAARVVAKDRGSLDELHRAWLAASPFCLVATSGADGTCDVSPKGDPSGVVHVLDATTVAIPERPGNKRADGLRNVLRNPHVGLLSIIPGRGDTLRVNGRASIVRDAPFLAELEVRGHRPELALVVEVEQVFFHCSKAFLRSALWSPETWAPEEVPSRPRISKALERPDDELAELERYYGPEYAKHLYGE